MLAQNFKSARELGLSESMYTSLQKVLVMLETGELKWTTRYEPIPNGFNMGVVDISRENDWGEECGSVCCIVGWARRMSGCGDTFDATTAYSSMDQVHACHDLIMPLGYQTRKYTVEQAAIALRSYLTTGKPEWA